MRSNPVLDLTGITALNKQVIGSLNMTTKGTAWITLPSLPAKYIFSEYFILFQ